MTAAVQGNPISGVSLVRSTGATGGMHSYQYTGLADDPGRILDPVGGRRLVPGSDTYTVKLLRMEILEPLESLSQAMENLQQEQLEYRINDRRRRNSDEIRYLLIPLIKWPREIQLSRKRTDRCTRRSWIIFACK